MRTIVHLDADAFFASVEQAADARLRGKPIAVGGESRGIIASASYEARKFGVYTPMPTARARKLCPRLIVLPGDYERYEQFSNWMFSYAYDFTPSVEQTSIDEGYFDITAHRSKSPVEIALTISQAIRQSLKISVSEGIASNKLISQIASKLHKPAAFQTVPAGQEKRFLHPLPNRWLPGIGPQTAVRLNAAGLVEIGQIAATPVDMLALLLGSQAPAMRQFANGVDERPLIPASEPQKSFSQQETFCEDVTDEEYVEAVLRRMADKLFAAVREERRSVRTLTVKVRYNDRDENQRAESLREPTDLETDVYGRLRGLLREAWQRRVSLRMVSLKLSNVYDGVFHGELALEKNAINRTARERLAAVLDDLRRSKGWSVVLRGHDFRLRDAPVSLANTPRFSESSAQGNRTVLSPLPLGEGESSSTLSGSRGLEIAGRLSASNRVQSLSPSPSGRGIKAEGELCGNPLRQPRQRAKATTYIPLRVRSYYTFLDSTLSPTAIVNLAKQHGLPAIALTDLGNLHGAVEFAEAAKKAGIKPIFGTELQVGRHPLLLYVQSARGYYNLNRLLSKMAEDGTQNDETAVAARQRAPVTETFLRQHADLLEGLIAVSSDARLAELFPDRFYQLAAKSFVAASRQSAAYLSAEEWRRSADAPPRYCHRIVACPAIHYASPSERLKYDILQSIRTLTLLRQEHPSKRMSGQFHFRTPAEMAVACQEHPEWLAHSLEIAGRCNFEMPFGKPQFPAFVPPDRSTAREFLRRLVLDGARRRYAPSQVSNLKSQIEQELNIISAVGYEEYFLVVWSMLQDCRAYGIEWITRGSAADSLVCYCLGISDVCPIRFGLYFRRFLNPERMALNKLPDIDVDFPHDRKDDVVDLIFVRYGREQCAVVGGFSTFQARSAFADVAKVLGVAERAVRRFTEHFPWSFGGGWVLDEPTLSGGAKLRELLAASPENRDLPLDEEPFKTALEMAEFLDGFPRYPKMHPCGVVLSRQPMHELTPTFIANKGYPTTHYDMDAVEVIGLVKIDVLAQGGLAAMRDVKAMLARRGVEVDLKRCAVVEAEAGEQVRKWESENAGKGEANTDSVVSPSPSGSGIKGEGELCGNHPYAHRLVPTEESPPRCLGGYEGQVHGKGEEPWNDPAVWDMISTGNARAVHHIESPAMTGLCRQCNVRDIDTLIAIVSVIRPGAANQGKKLAFTRRYQGLEPITYPHPSLEPVLRDTFGLVVYEEHILQICEAFAGLNPGRADVLRRALNKQKRAVIAEVREEFFASAQARGHAPEKIEEVWGLVAGFAGYAFCKAHSTAYGVEAYQAAWLKRYYPAEFMAAVLTNGKGFYDPLVYVLEAHRLGVPFLPPTVNEPGPSFLVCSRRGNEADSMGSRGLPPPHVGGYGSGVQSARRLSPSPSGRGIKGEREWCDDSQRQLRLQEATEDSGNPSSHPPGGTPGSTAGKMPAATHIRVPLTRAKGLTERTVERLLAERESRAFASLADFHHRVQPSPEELEILIRAGGFDEFGQTRTRQFWEARRFAKSETRSSESETADRNLEFDFDGGRNPVEDFLAHNPSLLREPTRRERLEAETELFGYAVSGHPLELFADVAWDTYCPVARLGEHIGQTVVTCGLVVEQRTHHQITGEPMKFLTLADWTGMVETELFAQTYRSYGLATVRYPVLEVTATVEPFENGRGFSLRVLRAGKPRSKQPTDAPRRAWPNRYRARR
jgi:DNA polymerase III alpha subunit/nucleotidyltransferase/DNA polymerase involved in DNA repair